MNGIMVGQLLHALHPGPETRILLGKGMEAIVGVILAVVAVVVFVVVGRTREYQPSPDDLNHFAITQQIGNGGMRSTREKQVWLAVVVLVVQCSGVIRQYWFGACCRRRCRPRQPSMFETMQNFVHFFVFRGICRGCGGGLGV